MSDFNYIARQRSGAQIRGTIAAATTEEAARLIREQSLFPVKIESVAIVIQLFDPWEKSPFPNTREVLFADV